MVPMGRAADHEDLWLQPYDLLELMPRMAEARQRCDAIGLKLWPGDNVGYFGPFEHLIRFERTRTGHSGGCGEVARGREADEHMSVDAQAVLEHGAEDRVGGDDGDGAHW